MAGTKSLTRNRKIEPLNWAEAANSPALKGMMSFLDLSPDEVRSGQFKGVPSEQDFRIDPISETLTGSESHGSDKSLGTSSIRPVIEMRPHRAHITEQTTRARETRIELPNGATRKIPPVSQSLRGGDTLPVGEALAVGETLPISETLPVGDSLHSTGYILGSIPSLNRKIRKCRLSQDAHSSGEEMLYRILWEEGKPETTNALGTRIVRIGYAELSSKARMHKANVRLNLANLVAKLAIEQSGDFNSRDMIAKAYRVYSFKEILERRRAGGLEYVVRQKNVVFVTSTGDPIPLPGLATKGRTGRVPRTEISEPKALSRVQGIVLGDSLPVSDSHTGSNSPIAQDEDMRVVSRALNTYWPVDDGAADQLIRACRVIRSDATSEEIAFFVLEKLDLARTSRTITNPTGLILATVPQSFSGYSFDTFRMRRQESKRLAEEERDRKAKQDREIEEWLIKEAKKTLTNPKSTDKERREAEEAIQTFTEVGEQPN
jgi:hypothetical protein